jgi:hypothetical protein
VSHWWFDPSAVLRAGGLATSGIQKTLTLSLSKGTLSLSKGTLSLRPELGLGACRRAGAEGFNAVLVW